MERTDAIEDTGVLIMAALLVAIRTRILEFHYAIATQFLHMIYTEVGYSICHEGVETIYQAWQGKDTTHCMQYHLNRRDDNCTTQTNHDCTPLSKTSRLKLMPAILQNSTPIIQSGREQFRG